MGSSDGHTVGVRAGPLSASVPAERQATAQARRRGAGATAGIRFILEEMGRFWRVMESDFHL